MRAVREQEAMTLSNRDRKAFVHALLNPPAPGTLLRRQVNTTNSVMDISPTGKAP